MAKRNNKEYKLVVEKPVARFFYKGHHSHPIRRTVLIIEDNENLMIGYELREGNVKRPFRRARIKTYLKSKISKYGDYCRLTKSKKSRDKKPSQTTLKRENLLEVIKYGI